MKMALFLVFHSPFTELPKYIILGPDFISLASPDASSHELGQSPSRAVDPH